MPYGLLILLFFSRSLKIPSHLSILHVEQEATGDDTIALQSVLECDQKREGLLKSERELREKLKLSEYGTFLENLTERSCSRFFDLAIKPEEQQTMQRTRGSLKSMLNLKP